MIDPNIHIVILGAGSTVATIPNGGANGIKAFTLQNFSQDPFFEPFFKNLPKECISMDFEDLCTYLYTSNKTKYTVLNSLIREKYSMLVLPEGISILEKLILSLNETDYIVSFNWDSLILQAYNRVLGFIPEQQLPQMLFPHGNVEVGYTDTMYGCISNPQNTGYEHSPLNMPVDDTEYLSNRFIQDQWTKFERILVQTRMITFFGYCGPKSDNQDVDHMFNLFDHNPICAKIEIIDRDIPSAKLIRDKWIKHIWKTEVDADLCNSFYKSRMALRPKRSIQSLESWNKLSPNDFSFTEEDNYSTMFEKINNIKNSRKRK